MYIREHNESNSNIGLGRTVNCSVSLFQLLQKFRKKYVNNFLDLDQDESESGTGLPLQFECLVTLVIGSQALIWRKYWCPKRDAAGISIGWGSDFQPGFRETPGFREHLPTVPQLTSKE